MSAADLTIIASQPDVKVWGEQFDELETIMVFKGKFVVTEDGKFFAKLFPRAKWDSIEFFHNMLVEELGVQESEGMDVKEVVIGGGKIEVELFENHLECRLWGKSTIYGDYEPEEIDTEALQMAIGDAFELDIPVYLIADYEE